MQESMFFTKGSSTGGRKKVTEDKLFTRELTRAQFSRGGGKVANFMGKASTLGATLTSLLATSTRASSKGLA